ncbi:MAG TPA: hypothetical protein VNE17_00405, partial [Nitrolancea sp.]|nr:hypothetical protein [Nitrolancea sp.]
MERPVVAAHNGVAAESTFQVERLCDIRVGHTGPAMGQPEAATTSTSQRQPSASMIYGRRYRINSTYIVTALRSSRRSEKLGRFPEHTRTVLSCGKTILFNRMNITLLGVPSDIGETDLRILKSP